MTDKIKDKELEATELKDNEIEEVTGGKTITIDNLDEDEPNLQRPTSHKIKDGLL